MYNEGEQISHESTERSCKVHNALMLIADQERIVPTYKLFTSQDPRKHIEEQFDKYFPPPPSMPPPPPHINTDLNLKLRRAVYSNFSSLLLVRMPRHHNVRHDYVHTLIVQKSNSFQAENIEDSRLPCEKIISDPSIVNNQPSDQVTCLRGKRLLKMVHYYYPQ